MLLNQAIKKRFKSGLTNRLKCNWREMRESSL
jgi:hypothetical protein